MTADVADESTQSMTVVGIHRQIQLIQEVMKSEMKKGEHYGTIPGCGPKPALMKAGAEKLSLLFKMAPRFKIEMVDLGNGHREYRIVTELYHIISGKFLGEGLGSSSTMETKHRYRNLAKKCPVCDGEFIIKGKEEYGGGWLCFAKKGGCGAKFTDGDKEIESQEVGKKENEDIADTYNTVLKMGKKRSLVDAVLTATAASDIFTQDIDEMGAAAADPTPAEEHREPIDEPQRASEGSVPRETPKAAPAPKDPPQKQSGSAPAAKASTFSGSTCFVCKGKINKGDMILKNPRTNSWTHEACK